MSLTYYSLSTLFANLLQLHFLCLRSICLFKRTSLFVFIGRNCFSAFVLILQFRPFQSFNRCEYLSICSCLSIYLSIQVSYTLILIFRKTSIQLSICMSVSLSIQLSIKLSISLSRYLSLYLGIYLSI